MENKMDSKEATLIGRMDSKQPTALLIGRFQPFHDGHLALVQEAINRVGQVCIGIRDTHNTDEKNPYSFQEVCFKIMQKLPVELIDKVTIVKLPNITNFYYGRDVGYKIEQIELSPELQAISATKIRREEGK